MTVFLVKGIRPAKLKVGRVRLELLNALKREGTTHKKHLRKTVATWRGDKPKFDSLVGLGRPPGAATVVTGPSGNTKGVKKWVWLDEGTRSHIIAARRTRTLMFRSGGFIAKTRPKVFRSGPGRSATGPVVFPKAVRHPGIKAREWSKTLSKRRRKPFTRRMIMAMQKGAMLAF